MDTPLDALTVSLHELSEKEAKQRMEKFKEALEETVKDLVASHFPETHQRSGYQVYHTHVAIAFPEIYVGPGSAFKNKTTDIGESWNEDAFHAGLTNHLFQKRIQRLVQASELSEKETT